MSRQKQNGKILSRILSVLMITLLLLPTAVTGVSAVEPGIPESEQGAKPPAGWVMPQSVELAAQAYASYSDVPSGAWNFPLKGSYTIRYNYLQDGTTGYTAGRTHLGEDIMTAAGSEVYPVAHGTVIEARADVGGYANGGNAAGGGVVVKHLDKKGDPFYALYAHLNLEKTFAVGEVVGTTTLLGKVLNWIPGNPGQDHLHLGIRTRQDPYDTYDTAGGIWRGFLDSNGQTAPDGYPNPIQWLNANMGTGAPNFGINQKAQIVFVIDITGSMGEEIENVRQNIYSMAKQFENEGVDAEIGIIFYSDLGQTVIKMAGNTMWHTSYKQVEDSLKNVSLVGGQEVLLDGLGELTSPNGGVDWDPRADRFAVVLTDEDYRSAGMGNRWGYSNIDDLIVDAVDTGLTVSVITDTSLYPAHQKLVDETGGIMGNIYGNFAEIISELTSSMAGKTTRKRSYSLK